MTTGGTISSRLSDPTPSCKGTYSERALAYAKSIVAKKRLASKWTRLACQRHIDDLERAKGDWKFRYDDYSADRVCGIIEKFTHEKGPLQFQRIRLEDWQCFILCAIFGWLDRESGFRRFREALVMVPRGNGKSPLAAWIGLVLAFFDGEGGAEVYSGASTEDQAFEVFRPAKAIVEDNPTLRQRVGIQVNAKSLVNVKTRSRFRPVVGKPRDGAAPHGAVVDEFHEHLDAGLYDCFKTGMVKRKQPLLFVISTAGATIEGPCYTLQQDLQKVLDGVTENERLFGVIYQADPEIDWTTREASEMANPNYGVSIEPDSLEHSVHEAVTNSSKQNIVRCKHLNQWMQATTSWMNMQAWKACHDPKLKEEDFLEDDCWLGSDLASKIDLSAQVKLFRRQIGGRVHYYAFLRCYVPEARVKDPSCQHYQRWEHDGFLVATEGSSMDYEVLEKDATSDIERFRVEALCYDERYADQFSQRVSSATGVTRVVVKPNPGELSPAMKELEAAVLDKRFHHDGHPILTWAMSNVTTRETSAGNYTMPDKQRPENKIDPAVALFIAMVRARVAEGLSTFDGNVETW